MKVTSEKINEIAQELEAGMKVYINRETLEIKSVLDWEDTSDNEFWEEETEEVFNEWSDFIVISKMESWEAFKVMEEFVDFIEDEHFSESLIKILSRKSPFANFKAEVESSPYRQDWFDFKLSKYEDYVREHLEIEDFDIN
jgi:hypothetical protein